jgi:hypothetical protein
MSPQSDPERDKARALLARFLPRAMHDSVLDEVEKRQLIAILTSGVLGKDDVQAVFRDYLLTLHREALADGLLTPAELDRVRTIVAELRIPAGFLPPELAAVVG